MNRPHRLGAPDAFLHVIYEHRYFTAASAAWTTFCSPARSPGDHRRAKDLARDLPVLIQDSVLVHARTLIEFYGDPAGRRLRETDLHVSQFGGTAPAAISPIAHYEEAISVHALHPTSWRDVADRMTHAGATGGANRQRPDWDVELPTLITGLEQCLEQTASSPSLGGWQTPFETLRDACRSLKGTPSMDWPTQLGEKPAVGTYLASLGLA